MSYNASGVCDVPQRGQGDPLGAVCPDDPCSHTCPPASGGMCPRSSGSRQITTVHAGQAPEGRAAQTPLSYTQYI